MGTGNEDGCNAEDARIKPAAGARSSWARLVAPNCIIPVFLIFVFTQQYLQPRVPKSDTVKSATIYVLVQCQVDPIIADSSR